MLLPVAISLSPRSTDLLCGYSRVHFNVPEIAIFARYNNVVKREEIKREEGVVFSVSLAVTKLNNTARPRAFSVDIQRGGEEGTLIWRFRVDYLRSKFPLIFNQRPVISARARRRLLIPLIYFVSSRSLPSRTILV